MEAVIFFSFIVGYYLLRLSARQTCTDLQLSDVPMRIRHILRSRQRGFWVEKVEVSLQDGNLLYCFSGSTPKRKSLSLVLLDSSESALFQPPFAPNHALPRNASRLFECWPTGSQTSLAPAATAPLTCQAEMPREISRCSRPA